MLNWDIPRAKIIHLDGKEEEVDLEHVIKLFSGAPKEMDMAVVGAEDQAVGENANCFGSAVE